ncbi:MAG: hypothetical protein IPG89_21930 [Bacteroidetes bacterium]|nr:hypothetical protein [Bacteroidota bacterium]
MAFAEGVANDNVVALPAMAPVQKNAPKLKEKTLKKQRKIKLLYNNANVKARSKCLV